MAHLPFVNMTTTAFKKNGDLDEEGFRGILHRQIDAGIAVFLGSAGCGEGHALTPKDLKRVYEIGVEECRGKVPAYANIPEQHTALLTIEQAEIALRAKVDVIHIYVVERRHGFVPTDDECMAYFDDVLSVIKHPVALSVNPNVAGVPKPSVVAAICQKYPQIIAIRMSQISSDLYRLELQERIKRPMQYFVRLTGSPYALMSANVGVFGTKASIFPKTVSKYRDLMHAKKFEEAAPVFADLIRIDDYVRKWNPGSPRWLKMAMKIFKLPGGEGGPRRPYLLPAESELQKFTEGLLKLRVPEINEMARAAGITVTA